MNENFVGQFHLEPDDGFTSAVALDRIAVNRSRVAIARRRQAITRRGPRRAITSSRTLFSQYSAGWAFDIGDDLLSLKIIAEALFDRGSATAITDGFEWSIGRPNGHRTFAGYAVTADGRSYRLNKGICQEVALTVEPNRIVGAEARFEFASINDGVALADADTVAAPTTYASPVNASVVWGGETIPVFALALNIRRELAPAGIDEDGVARAVRGPEVPDIVGKMIARVPADDDDLFLDQVTRSLSLEITVAGKIVTLSLPNVVFENLNRTVVDRGSVEHELEFLAVLSGNDPLATFALAEP